MKKLTVLKFFKNSVTDVANACGVSVAAVSQWEEVIPEKQALKLDRLTDGKLTYKPRLYQKNNAA